MAGLARPSERQDVDTPDDVGATSHYSLLIEWDPRDAIFFVVTVPELEGCGRAGPGRHLELARRLAGVGPAHPAAPYLCRADHRGAPAAVAFTLVEEAPSSVDRA